jgi:type I restriction enzyme S subunit
VNTDFPEPAFVNQHVALVRPDRSKVHPRYLAFALHSEVGRVQFKNSEYGGTKQGLGLDDVKSALLPVPPVLEQGLLCSYLENKLRDLLEAIDVNQREISLVREYRTRLVADVVTGKLDVREVAARLPLEAEEPEIEPGVEEQAQGEEGIENGDLIAAAEQAGDAE